MTNDPDLLDQECPDCSGNGFFMEPMNEDDVSAYEDCATCDGQGVVLR